MEDSKESPPLQLTAVLAEKRLGLEEVLGLRTGKWIRFDKPADAPLALELNGRPIAWGRAVTIADRFGLLLEAVSALPAPREVEPRSSRLP